jgi:hypothetical protein
MYPLEFLVTFPVMHPFCHGVSSKGKMRSNSLT